MRRGSTLLGSSGKTVHAMNGKLASKALYLASAAAFMLGGAPAFASLKVTVARITEGHLWVMGQSEEPSTSITLDGAFERTTDRRGNFEFRVVYHPATCIVTVETPKQKQEAVVANCGQMGPAGPSGPPGPQGAAGPPGPTARSSGDNEPPASKERATSLNRRPETSPSPPEQTVSPPRGDLAKPPAVAEPSRPHSEQPAPAPGGQGARPPAPTEPPRQRPERPPPAPGLGATTAPTPAATGEWFVEDGVARIKIQPCGAALCGAVSWSKAGGEVGTQILRSMKPAGHNKWEGTIYDPSSGRTYQSTVTLQNPNSLRVEGCVLGFLCGGQTWTRAKE